MLASVVVPYALILSFEFYLQTLNSNPVYRHQNFIDDFFGLQLGESADRLAGEHNGVALYKAIRADGDAVCSVEIDVQVSAEILVENVHALF